ncbi:MAG: TonB-dependent receptor [Pseudomonadota bacterium]
MPHITPRGKLRYLIHSCLAASLTLPLIAHAQAPAAAAAAEPEVEEVVVTGSYIRNSAFAQNSPVDTVSQVDLFESGAPSMSNYIRELTYTQNTDVVANVLATSDGAQDAVAASFNLRGLGENSTLTLFDGTRTLSPAVSSALPEIAIDRLELVLDGGSALYGSDAVAGVVNILPQKEFEGFKARTYYQTTEEDGMEEMTASAMWGHTFDNGISYVGAIENKKKTPLMQYERLREWEMAYGSSTSGSPGSFRRVTTPAPAGVRLYQRHGGVVSTAASNRILIDPSCGTFNGGSPVHGQGKYSTPSGVPQKSATGALTGNCLFDYTQQFAYSTEEENYNVYNSVSYEAAEWLRLNATLNNSYRISNGRTTATTAVAGNNQNVLYVRANHPANPYGFDVVPWNWRPMAASYTHRPSHIEDSGGSRAFETHTQLNRIKLSAEYDITETWTGYSYYATQESKSMNDSYSVHLGKLQLGLAGLGGPNGNEYWNPFGSADPRSPLFVQGKTSNSKEITEWLYDRNKNVVSQREELDIFETVLTGELFAVPAGAVQGAFGYQWRDFYDNRFANDFDAMGLDYNTVVGAPLPEDEHYASEVRAAFMELEVPILETLALQAAVRHEQFKDFGLEATTPKVALRWEPIPTVALRASWGESFLAPTAVQSRPYVRDENCGEVFSGRDPFTNNLLIGATTCSAGNPNLAPETSTIKNFGGTWEPAGVVEGLTLSLDYQEIEYTDRIRTLNTQDTVTFQFQQFLSATGIGAYDYTAGSATRTAANAWLADYATGAGGAVDRRADQSVSAVYTQAANISTVWIDLIDVNAEYEFDTDNLGTFSTTLQTTYYKSFEYQDLFGGVQDAVGSQNANTGIVPPMPKFKSNVRFSWFRDNQSASLAANYWHTIKYNDVTVDAYNDGWIPPRTIKGEMRWDARYSIVLSDYLDSEFNVSVGINNLFDKRPQRMPMQGGFESRLSTPWGRQFWASVEWTPGA